MHLKLKNKKKKKKSFFCVIINLHNLLAETKHNVHIGAVYASMFIWRVDGSVALDEHELWSSRIVFSGGQSIKII